MLRLTRAPALVSLLIAAMVALSALSMGEQIGHRHPAGRSLCQQNSAAGKPASPQRGAATAGKPTGQRGTGLAAGTQGVPARGEKWAVIIGVNEYKESAIINPLRFCVEDADLFAEMLRCKPDHIIRLSSPATDGRQRPTRDNILAAITKLAAKARSGDQFWLFFAGHGCSQGGINYLLPSDAVPPGLDTFVSEPDLVTALKDCKASMRGLVLDACRSNATRSVAAPFTVLMQGGKGNFVFAACRIGEAAHEFEDIRHGAFTYTLVAGMTGAGLDQQKETISLADLKAYVDTEMKNRVADQQHPEFAPEARPDVIVATRNTGLAARLEGMKPGKAAPGRKPLEPFVVVVPDGPETPELTGIIGEVRQACVSAKIPVYNDDVAQEFLRLRAAGDQVKLKQRFLLPYVLKVTYKYPEPDKSTVGKFDVFRADVTLRVQLEDAEGKVVLSLPKTVTMGATTRAAALKKACDAAKAWLIEDEKLADQLKEFIR